MAFAPKFNRRVRGPRQVKRQPRTLVRLESLEDRCVPDGTLPAGVYIEDFADDLDPSRAGFDGRFAYQHTIEAKGQTHRITDPRDISGLDGAYEIVDYGNPANDDLLLRTGLDRITFPNFRPDVHVAFAAVDLWNTVGASSVEFVGQNGSVVVNFEAADRSKNASAGEGHILPSGKSLGAIREVILSSSYTWFDGLRILAVPSDAPRALDDFVGTPPNTKATFDVLENDWDAKSLYLRIDEFTQPAKGGEVVKRRVRPAGGGPYRDGFEYTPAKDFHGQDSFTYTIVNTAGQKATATVYVSVNTLPVGGAKTISLEHGTPGPINGFVNPIDPDGDPLSDFEIISQPSHGTVTLREDGFFSYQPTPIDMYDYFTGRTFENVSTIRGPDEFTYRVHDGFDASDCVVKFDVPNFLNVVLEDDSFIVQATPKDDPPRFISWGAPGVLFNDFGLVTVDDPKLGRINELGRAPGIDGEGDPLSTVLAFGGEPDHGALVLNTDGSFFYTPDPGYEGLDGFVYHVTDGWLWSENVQVTLSVEKNLSPHDEAKPGDIDYWPPPWAADDEYDLRDFPKPLEKYYLDGDNGHRTPLFNDPSIPWLDTDPYDPLKPAYTVEIVRGSDENQRGFAEYNFKDMSGRRFGLGSSFWGEGRHSFTYAFKSKELGHYSNFANVTVNLRTVDSDGDGVHDSEDFGPSPNPFYVRLPVMLGAPELGGPDNQPRLRSASNFSNVKALPNPHPSDSPPGVVFPIGFITFQLNLAPGENATSATLTLPPGVTMSGYYKYGPEKDNLWTTEIDETNPAPHWWEFTWDPVGQTGAQFGVNADGQQEITLYFVDGQRGDEDETAGIITDPGAPGTYGFVAHDDAYGVTVGQSLNVYANSGLLANDQKNKGSKYTPELAGNATKGTLTLRTDGSFTYKPTKGVFDGIDTFTYRMRDELGRAGNVATVTLATQQVNFRTKTASIWEGNYTARLYVDLRVAPKETTTIDYRATGGAATSDNDYVLANGTLTFKPGQRSAFIPIQIKQDKLDEFNETIQVTLSNPTNAVLGAQRNSVLRIVDNDAPPAVQFREATSTVAENSGFGSAEVRLSAPSAKAVRVKYAIPAGIYGGTAARNGIDYAMNQGTLTFEPGETVKVIPFTVTDDLLDERNETFTIVLSAPQNAVYGPRSRHTYTISDNDDTPTVQFALAQSSFGEGAGTIDLTVTLSAASGLPVYVWFSVTGGTGRSRVDYKMLTPSPLLFQPGQTAKTIRVQIIDDTFDEPNETVLIALKSPLNGILGVIGSHAMSILDDE